MVTPFENISNAIAQIIKNDIDIQNYTTDKLGSVMNSQDNSVILEDKLLDFPFFVINKNDEQHFKNKGIQQSNGIKSIWSLNVVFLGDFSEIQEDDGSFKLPTVATETINGILTYTPSDIMRKIARMSGEVITTELECKVDNIWVQNYSIVADVYYSQEDGTVASRLDIELYEQSTNY